MSTKEKNIVLLHGIFDKKFFDELKKKKIENIFVLEGRPDFESSKHNCRELLKRNIHPTLIADNMAGFLFFKNLVKEVWLSYQLNDKKGAVSPIGSLILAVLGKTHHVPVYLQYSDRKNKLLGKQNDIFSFNKIKVAPAGIRGYVPLVDWVPSKYITKIYE